MKNGKVTTRIKDDGKGFELNHDRRPSDPSTNDNNDKFTFGGNGLGNMQQRANELKGKLRIDSAVGQGTEVEVAFVV
jgi:signal transduction histidine kinase